MTTILDSAASLFKAAFSYFSSESYEDQQLNSLDQACQALETEIKGVFPLAMESQEGSKFTRLENAISLLQDNQVPLNPDLLRDYRSALKAYQSNLSGFIDSKYSGSTLHERALEALKQASASPEDKKLSYRAEYYQNCLRDERLNRGLNEETRTYAQFIDQREQLRLAFQFGLGRCVEHSEVESCLSQIDDLGLDDSLVGNIKLQLVPYNEAKENYQKQFDRWFENDNSSTRVLCKQAQLEATAPGEQQLLWQGRAEILEKRVEQLDKVVKAGFETLFDAYHTEVEKESTSLHDHLVQLDPAAVGESRWGNSGWKVVQLFTWIGNAVSGWQNRGEIEPLKNKYELLEKEKSTSAPSREADVTSWIRTRSEVEKLLPKDVRERLQEQNSTYTAQASGHLRHESLEAVVAGTDKSDEERLKDLYQALKEKHPGLKGKEGESFNYDLRTRSLYITGDDFQVLIGGGADKFARDEMLPALNKNDSELTGISNNLRYRVIPPNIIGHIKWTGTNKREALYESPQIATFTHVGSVGSQDLLDSKIAVSDRLVYELDKEAYEVRITSGIRFGCFASEFGGLLKEAPVWLQAIALPILNTLYSSGAQLTLNLTGLEVQVDNGVQKGVLSYTLNETDEIPLERGDVLGDRLKELARDNPPSQWLRADQLNANFEGIKWETV